jgi:hypothetical protein
MADISNTLFYRLIHGSTYYSPNRQEVAVHLYTNLIYD